MNRFPDKGVWYVVALFFGAFAVWYAYRQEWVAIEQLWRTRDEWSYGYLVLPLAAAIAWSRLKRFPEIPVRPAFWAGAAVILSGLALRYASLWAGIISVSWASMVVVIAGVAIGILGIRFLRVLYVPLIYLFLMFPWPTDVYERVALPMQRAAAVGSIFILDLVGILARRDGNVIHLYGGSLEVAQACSGLRLLLAFVSVAGAVAFIAERPRWQRMVILVSSLPVAVIANMARVVTTAMAAEWFGMEAASGWFHGTAGYAMIVLAFGLFWFELWFLGRIVIPENLPAGDEQGGTRPFWRPQAAARPVLAALFLGLPLVASGLLHPAIERELGRSAALQPFLPLRRSLAEFPDRFAGYEARAMPLDADVVAALKADEYLRKILVDDEGREVGTIFVSYNGVARKFYTHRPTVCMPSAGWMQVSEARRETRTPEGRVVPYSSLLFNRGGQRLVILAYFNASGTLFTRVELLRLKMATPGPGFVSQVMVSVFVPPGGSEEAAEARARGLLEALTDEIEAFLPETGPATAQGEV